MTFALSKVSMPPINILENHSVACLEKRSCDFNCFKLTRVNNVKYLSIYFDEDMKWKLQINLSIKRLKKLFYIFKELNIILDLFTLRSVYFALVKFVILQYSFMRIGLPDYCGTIYA